MKKNVLQAIKRRAAQLPAILTTVTENHLVKGATLLDQGQTEWAGEPINPKSTYLQKMPVILETNHYRRMKRAYETHGLDGIKAYENGIADIAAKRKAEEK